MSKILKNQTASAIVIGDTGITVPATPATYTIPAQDYFLWAASSNIVTEVGAGNIIVNDGSVDLSITDGIDLIKGIFPQDIALVDQDGVPIVVTNNALGTYVDAESIIDVVCELKKLNKGMDKLVAQLSFITDEEI